MTLPGYIAWPAFRDGAPAPARSAGRSASDTASPLASHIFGYMLMEVNPGMVLISLMKNLPVAASIRKSTRAMPSQSHRLVAFDRQALDFARLLRRQIGGHHGLGLVREDTCLRNRRTRATAEFRTGPPPSGSSLPSTEHSNSRPTMPRSIEDLAVELRRRIRAPRISSSQVFAFEMPTDDPRFAGLTNTGNGKFAAHIFRVENAPRARTMYSTTGRPRSATGASSLLYPSRPPTPARPAPTYGRSASSSRPCTVPSSPKVPCSTGNTTSIPDCRRAPAKSRARLPAAFLGDQNALDFVALAGPWPR